MEIPSNILNIQHPVYCVGNNIHKKNVYFVNSKQKINIDASPRRFCWQFDG